MSQVAVEDRLRTFVFYLLVFFAWGYSVNRAGSRTSKLASEDRLRVYVFVCSLVGKITESGGGSLLPARNGSSLARVFFLCFVVCNGVYSALARSQGLRTCVCVFDCCFRLQ